MLKNDEVPAQCCYLCKKDMTSAVKIYGLEFMNMHQQAHIARFLHATFSKDDIRAAFYQFAASEDAFGMFMKAGKNMLDI